MMHLHVDCFSGISGDMFLGALVDGGLQLGDLKRGLKKMDAGDYQLRERKVHRGTIHATKVDVLIRDGFTKPLSLPTIRRLITKSRLPAEVKTRSLGVFDRLAEAEGIVHGIPSAKVHFHEVGVLDSLVDIVGAFLGLSFLGVETISASPVNVGSGTTLCEHGTLPVPPPVVALLSKGIPIYSAGPTGELATPTGIGVLTALTQQFGPLPSIAPARVGYGAGDTDHKGWPNVLRVFLSDGNTPKSGTSEDIVQIETNIDDLNPQAYETAMERLFAAGALDVTLTPVIMKRSRPGILITALALPNAVEALVQALFEETTTLGVRILEMNRRVLPRRLQTLRLRQGPVRVKVADVAKGVTKMMPEFRDCKIIAEKTGRPVREVLEEAFHVFKKEQGYPKGQTRTTRKPRR